MTEEMVELRDGAKVPKGLAEEKVRSLDDLQWQSYTAFQELVRAADDTKYSVSNESAQFLVDWVVINFNGTAMIDDLVRAIIRNAVNRKGALWEVQSPFKDNQPC